jgi:hypothetical protein
VPSVVAEGLDDHLHRWAGEGREGFVFAAPDGGHIDPDNFRSRIWTPAVAGAGLAPLRIHDLRHTTASFAIAAGADVKTLQPMLGHASAVMTLDRYGLMPGRGEDVARLLDALARSARTERIPAAIGRPVNSFIVGALGTDLRARADTEHGANLRNVRSTVASTDAPAPPRSRHSWRDAIVGVHAAAVDAGRTRLLRFLRWAVRAHRCRVRPPGIDCERGGGGTALLLPNRRIGAQRRENCRRAGR